MYSLFTDTTRGAGIFTDAGKLPPVTESWRRLIPEDARWLGGVLTSTLRSARCLGERALQLGASGAHAGIPAPVEQVVAPSPGPAGRHSVNYLQSIAGGEVVYAAELVAAAAAARHEQLTAARSRHTLGRYAV